MNVRCVADQTIVGKRVTDLVARAAGVVREPLDAHVGVVAVDVGERVGRQIVHERRGVLAEHRDVGDLLDRHQRRREIDCELVLVRERAAAA